MNFAYREYLTQFPGTTDFRLILRPVITVKVIAGFVDFGSPEDELIVLGHGACLDYFTAIFDGENAVVELVPNSLLPT